MPTNVLVVEDNDSVARLLKQALTEAGHVVTTLEDGAAALALLTTQPFDIILLDIMLPGLNGVEVCRGLRKADVRCPVLMITARDTTAEKIEGLDAGADDYIVKPFQVAELLARMRALLRRNAAPPAVLHFADLSLDPATRQASRGGKIISLSATEYSLLEYLMRNAGQVVSRSQILDQVWQYDFGGNDNVIDVYISYLRQKIDKGRTPTLIHTVRGVGFQMTVHDG